MAENNSSAPLLPCPFCGASARGYEIEPHQHSAALLALVPNMPKEHHGSYAIEGDCQCGSGLIGNNQAEVTARWNARSPQAVAAQAAPAAVAVPEMPLTDDPRPYYEDQPDGYTESVGEWVDRNITAVRWFMDHHSTVRAALAASPALPATDSSAGDLAEVKIADEMSREERMIVLQRDSDGTPIVWCDPEIADIVCALNSGGVKTVASCSGHGVKPGGIALADGRQLLLLESLEAFNSAMSAITQAEVQAEPVAWMRKTDITELTDSEPETNGWTPLYVAPQAQPADALDAKRWRAAAHDLSLKNLALVSVDDYGACEMLTGDEANEAIDAAMASAQEGGNAAKEV